MTQKQLIDQFCEFRGKCTTDDVVALTYAYKSLQLDFINKACEWFEKTFKASELIAPLLLVQLKDNFRKAMEGGSSEIPNNSKKGGNQ